MSARVLTVTALVECECGEEYDFDGIEDGWQHLVPCDECGRHLSIQIDEPIVQMVSRDERTGATS